MNLITKRIIALLAGLLLLLGVYALSMSARPQHPLATLPLPPTLIAGLLISSGLALLTYLFYAPTVAVEHASAYTEHIDLQYFGLAAAPEHQQVAHPLAAQHYAAIVSGLDEGLLLLNADRVIVAANPVISQLLALPVSQLVGHPAGEIPVHNEVVGQLLRYLDAPANQRPVPGPVLTIAQGAEESHYQLLVRELPSPGNSTSSANSTLLVLRNVTEQKKLDQAKWHFLAKVSQELQTPLATMQLSLKRLQEGAASPLTPEQQNIAYTLTRENKHLLKLVEELLSVSRLELGTIQLNFQAVRLPTLAQFVADTIRPQLQPKRLVLDVHVPADLPAARADLEKTTWVLLSLLANAIRYAHLQDHLHLRAQLVGNGQHLRVSVQDQGPGIAPADQARIFQRFSQIPTQGGSGLGLSIAREFVASQGGELGVKSEVGHGSTFWFTLPLAGPAAA